MYAFVGTFLMLISSSCIIVIVRKLDWLDVMGVDRRGRKVAGREIHVLKIACTKCVAALLVGLAMVIYAIGQ